MVIIIIIIIYSFLRGNRAGTLWASQGGMSSGVKAKWNNKLLERSLKKLEGLRLSACMCVSACVHYSSTRRVTTQRRPSGERAGWHPPV